MKPISYLYNTPFFKLSGYKVEEYRYIGRLDRIHPKPETNGLQSITKYHHVLTKDGVHLITVGQEDLEKDYFISRVLASRELIRRLEYIIKETQTQLKS